MNYYLVTGYVSKSEYMGDTTSENITNLVYADDEENAEVKFVQFWENKTVDYYCYYSVTCVEVQETIK